MRGDSLGFARTTAGPASLRPSLLCFGLFLDLGGRDTYTASRGGNGTRWIHAGRHDGEKALGVDGEYPDYRFPPASASDGPSDLSPRP